jgi:hypothetical protein
MKNKITQVLQHDISWFVSAKIITELDSASIEHIEECIKNGINQGELCISYFNQFDKEVETIGWWYIINWQDIALQCYNALKATNTKQKKDAIKRFDKEWVY